LYASAWEREKMMTIIPSNLHFLILLIFALPAILFLLLTLWGMVFKGYSDFFVQDVLVKQKLEKFIKPNYKGNYNDFGMYLDYIIIGIMGFIYYGLLWIIYTLITYFFLYYFTNSYSGIFFTHITSIAFFLLFYMVQVLGSFDGIEK
jgi:amino acid transporter